MRALRPIHYKDFEKFLKHIGCQLYRQKGDHRAWGRSDLKRPVIVRSKKDLPIFEIRNNLRTLGISVEDYLNIIDEIL